MLFRQLFDAASSTYSYLIAARLGGEALIIDPALEKVDRYVTPLEAISTCGSSRRSIRTCTPTTSPASARCATARAASP